MTKDIARRILSILVLFAIFIVVISTNSLAVDNICTITMESDKEQIKEGESVTISVKVSNIQSENGIAIYNAIIEYDTNIFDVKTENNTDGTWTIVMMENAIIFTKANYEETKEDQEVGKIILTAKEGAELGTKTITLKENEVSDSDNTYMQSDVQKTIEIVKQTTQNSDDDENNSNSDDESNNNNSNNNSNSNNSNNDSDNSGSGVNSGNENTTVYTNSGTVNSGKSGTSLPKTGIAQDILIGAIIVTIVGAIGFYIKYKKAY